MPHKRSYFAATSWDETHWERWKRDQFYRSSPGAGRSFASVCDEDVAAVKSFSKARQKHRELDNANGFHSHNGSMAAVRAEQKGAINSQTRDSACKVFRRANWFKHDQAAFPPLSGGTVQDEVLEEDSAKSVGNMIKKGGTASPLKLVTFSPKTEWYGVQDDVDSSCSAQSGNMDAPDHYKEDDISFNGAIAKRDRSRSSSEASMQGGTASYWGEGAGSFVEGGNPGGATVTVGTSKKGGTASPFTDATNPITLGSDLTVKSGSTQLQSVGGERYAGSLDPIVDVTLSVTAEPVVALSAVITENKQLMEANRDLCNQVAGLLNQLDECNVQVSQLLSYSRHLEQTCLWLQSLSEATRGFSVADSDNFKLATQLDERVERVERQGSEQARLLDKMAKALGQSVQESVSLRVEPAMEKMSRDFDKRITQLQGELSSAAVMGAEPATSLTSEAVDRLIDLKITEFLRTDLATVLEGNNKRQYELVDARIASRIKELLEATSFHTEASKKREQFPQPRLSPLLEADENESQLTPPVARGAVAEQLFSSGSIVTLHSLSKAELNGQVGKVEKFDGGKGRYAVQVMDSSSGEWGKAILLKHGNLRNMDMSGTIRSRRMPFGQGGDDGKTEEEPWSS